MKKIVSTLLIVFIFVSYFMPINVNATASYSLKSIKKDGSITEIGVYNTYKEALENMNKNNSDDTLIIYQDDKVINANYAIGNIGGRGIIYIYQNATDKENGKKQYTYIEGDWGSDVAVLDYYEGKYSMVKIAISGVVGWTLSSNVDIIPLNTPTIKVTSTNGMNVRKEPSTNSEKLSKGVSYNEILTYYDIKTNEGYTWYKILLNNEYGWVASNNGAWVEKVNNELSTYYYVDDTDIKHSIRSTRWGVSKSTLGPKPSFLQKDKKYYSFDGIYFYTDVLTMVKDYKNNTYKNSINYNEPYYNYYMYLPTHSLTGYTKDDFNNIMVNLGYTKAPDPNVVYVDNNGSFLSSAKRDGVSALYGQGASFISFQNNYGINAFTAFSAALNESGRGTNVFSIGKNNVLSIGVCDGCKYIDTKKYDTVYDNLIAYASLVNSVYSNPTSSLYYGSHYGNKGSGMNVNYASDPYWGEKQAQISYLRDKEFGGNDYNANIIGIKQKLESVDIHKTPYSTSDVIYKLKNSYNNQLVGNIPLIIAGKVVTNEDGKENKWYKVYTDTALDENQNITSGSYSFSKSYGYVKASEIYVLDDKNVPDLNDDGYIDKDGLFHLESLLFENDKLNINGFLIVYDTNNLIKNNPKYMISFVNQQTNETIVKNLEINDKPVFPSPSSNNYDYSEAWFKGSLDLSDLKQGDYTVYVTAKINGYQTTALLSNKLFNENVTSKYTDSNNRGYLFKTNYYDSKLPLELFIRDEGLLSNKINPTTDNMYNQYYSMNLKDNKLEIIGTSHNVGGNYSSTSNIERQIVLENNDTLERKVYETSFLEEKPYKVSLRVSDNLDKTNAWYKSNVDLSSLEKGTYTVYVRTKTNEVDDFGEVYDITFTDINLNTKISDKEIKIFRNDFKRYRIEIEVK